MGKTKEENTNKLVVESCNGRPGGVWALSSSRTPDRNRVRVCTFPVMPEEKIIKVTGSRLYLRANARDLIQGRPQSGLRSNPVKPTAEERKALPEFLQCIWKAT
jgi:hypothetical protein